jgi:hypothetical protein
MAATFTWAETNGAVTPPAGETTARGECNWKNIDDSTSTYSSYPITVGNRSYDKFQYGKFTGSWNQITNIKYDHTSGAFGANLTLYGSKTMAAVGDRVSYRAPQTGTPAANSVDITTANGSFPSGGKVLYASATSPDSAGATSSITGGGTAYTCYVYTQLTTAAGAAAGDTTQVTMTLQYDEN